MPWLSNYEKRIKLTLDNTNVDDILSDFPVLIKLSDSSGMTSTDVTSVFTELGSDANRKKIAVTTSDETTQCYVEIERWDDPSEKAELWVKVPTVVSGTTTDLYLYYDSTQSDNTSYVGDTTDVVAHNVWDINAKTIQHMVDMTNSTISDSTSNAHAGTKASADNPVEVDGPIAKAQNFSNDEIVINDNIDFDLTGNFTIEACVNVNDLTSNRAIVSKFWDGSIRAWHLLASSNGYFAFVMRQSGDGSDTTVQSATDSATTGINIYVVIVNDGTNYQFYVNGIVSGNSISKKTMDINNANVSIGDYSHTSVHAYMDGLIDEVRISNTDRSAAWIKATYYSNWDGLVSFGSEQGMPTHYYYGYVTEEEFPVSRTVRLYYRDTGELIDTTTSSGSNGYYYLTTTISGEHFIVTIDNDTGNDYNALILDRLLPRGIE